MEKAKYDVRHEVCKRCIYYDVMTDIASHQQTGICRRRPPTTYAQAIPQPTAQGVQLSWNYSTMWTMVKETDWCGEGDFTRVN